MARITLGDLQPRKVPFTPADPSRDTFDQRFNPNDVLREYLDQQRGLRPVRPGTRERFGDPSKVISQDTSPPLSVPPSLGMPMPRTAQLAGRPASGASPVGVPGGPSGTPTPDYEVVQGPLSAAQHAQAAGIDTAGAGQQPSTTGPPDKSEAGISLPKLLQLLQHLHSQGVLDLSPAAGLNTMPSREQPAERPRPVVTLGTRG
jgi:hypothetical protein